MMRRGRVQGEALAGLPEAQSPCAGMQAGYIKEGDELTCHQPRKGRTFTAYVNDAGWIVHELDVFKGRPRRW